jgi:hypothetical protein
MPGDTQQADSLTPLLRWAPLEGDNAATYDLRVYKEVKCQTVWACDRFVPGQEVYYAEGIMGTEHRIPSQLEPNTYYLWTVRVRKGDAVGAWSSYDYNAGYPIGNKASHLMFEFVTPKS